jgi:hypothetical protein
VKVIALMSWYDESPTWLAATVASVARLCDHVVAVDGAYAHYPNGRGSSGIDQSSAVRMAAEAAGMGCTIHVPSRSWVGDEVAKRGFLFRAGNLVAEPDEDWFLVIDADEMIVECDVNAVRHQLVNTEHNTATVDLETYTDHTARDEGMSDFTHRAAHPARRLFRAATEPIRVEGQHWHYVARRFGRDEILWGRGDGLAEFLTGIRMEHRTHLRPPTRRADSQAYYRLRDAMRLERTPGKVRMLA